MQQQTNAFPRSPGKKTRQSQFITRIEFRATNPIPGPKRSSSTVLDNHGNDNGILSTVSFIIPNIHFLYKLPLHTKINRGPKLKNPSKTNTAIRHYTTSLLFFFASEKKKGCCCYRQEMNCRDRSIDLARVSPKIKSPFVVGSIRLARESL